MMETKQEFYYRKQNAHVLTNKGKSILQRSTEVLVIVSHLIEVAHHCTRQHSMLSDRQVSIIFIGKDYG